MRRESSSAIDRKFGRTGRRPPHPEFDKARKLLARSERGVDGQSARRQSIALALAERAKVAGAEEHQDLVLVLWRIDRVVHAKAREAEAAHFLRIDVVGPVVEQARIEANFADGVADHLADLDRIPEVEALVKKSELERQPFGAPERTIRLEADVAKMVVVEPGERRRQLVGATA